MRQSEFGPSTSLVDNLTDDVTISIGQLYGSVFSVEPFNREPINAAADYTRRLRTDMKRPGFTMAIATDPTAGTIVGFSCGWTTLAPFRTDRSYPQVREHLGDNDITSLLIGSFEVDELAVSTDVQGQGVGRSLLDTLVADKPRSWLLTWPEATATQAFYHHLGWRQYESQVSNKVVVYLQANLPNPGTNFPVSQH